MKMDVEARVCWVMLTILCAASILLNIHLSNKNTSAKKLIAAYESRMLFQSGWNYVSKDYSLVSFDGGRTWYNCVRNDYGFTINGEADKELLKNINAFDVLQKRLENGKIDLSNKNDVKILNDAGIEVKEKEVK